MKIGDKIRYFRKQKGMTLKQLSEDICSISYLSKIENNKEKPHQEVINKLFNRLGIPLEQDDPKQIEELNKELDEWYEVIKNRDVNKAVELEKTISEKLTNIESPSILTKYNLFSIRYQLLLGNLDKSKSIINRLQEQNNNFSVEHKYYFNYFNGLYHYLLDDFIESLKYSSKAERINQTLQVNEPELYYLLAITHSRLNHVTLAIQYTNIAFELFNQKLNYIRSAECQIIMAINYIRIRDLEKADYYLGNVLQLAEKLKDDYLLSNTYHNLGYLHSMKGEPQTAIEYYHKSLKYKEENEGYLNTIYYIIQEYFTIGKIDKVNEWIEKGLELTNENNKYYVKINVLKSILSLSKKDNDKKEAHKYIEEKAIPYFIKKQFWREVSEYAEKLADYYNSDGHYKKSSQYYKLANDARKKIYVR
ncbi:hypothetical protein BHF71_01660 [Vulcanibacillus modesticaldus]|uniref:HTH cro/C1-type domain-containing protein n=1 Tax=Vulcanibacillus modesticaldus TaxID=337097 RepID=A0A1D2YUH4_9BACI|nr:helix-turn-helix domain-containing protein [Vulcanibacillus modesticaldus]OEF99323.1 hypothetical protein BHF71_01660 [Vulcanibacillus modesticaldus]